MPTPEKHPLKVFLCHAHADRDSVRGLYTRLTKDGVDAWLDKAKLLPGQDWELEIRKAVREADVVVVCLSKQFNQAGFRQKEVRLALDTAMEKPEGEIFIIPARLEECDNLESLRKWHWVDLFEENGYEMLLRALRARADRIGAALKISRDQPPFVHETLKQAKPVEKKKELSQLQKTTPYKAITLMIGVLIVLTCLIALAWTGGSKFLNLIPTKSVESPVMFNPHPDSSDFIDSYGVPMRPVPAGEFFMGSDIDIAMEECQKYDKVNCEDLGLEKVSPQHLVYLDDFYVDKYEVTNASFKACVEASVCNPPSDFSSSTRSSYYENPDFDNYPVIYVNWDMAKTYCEWRSAYLPTEAQWEKSGRGVYVQTYPWGEDIDESFANYTATDTVAIGNYEKDKSPYGVYDLGGNVAEWVADWGSYATYRNSPLSNPLGPETGQERVIRGSAWGIDSGFVAAVYFRDWYNPSDSYYRFGFRCAKDINP